LHSAAAFKFEVQISIAQDGCIDEGDC